MTTTNEKDVICIHNVLSERPNDPVCITLGSLFDGIGGFPYAASFFGIDALWASEILPGAVSVTRRHLPRMEHVGDITQLHGGSLPPVDIITFGSPCQDVSAAGRRTGINGERSSLFFEAIRIINEMREATNGKYPTWAVWENVPGALSSNKGLDYKLVLEAFTEAEVPMPRSGKWANAGMVRGGRADVAWCVYNAQHFGTAQRRRRIFLVCDFGGKRAGEILFVPKSLRGYFEAGGTPRQGPAAYASRGADSTVEILNDQGGDSMNVEQSGCSPTLRSQTHGHLPLVCAGAPPDNQINNCLTPWDVQSRRVHDENGIWPTLYSGGSGGSGGHGYVAADAEKDRHDTNCLTPWDTQQSRIFTDDGASPTLAGADGGGGRNPGGLIYTAGFCGGAGAKAKGIGYEDECAPTLKGGGGGFQMPTVMCAAFMGDSSPSSYGVEYIEEGAPTLKPRLSGTPCLCEPIQGTREAVRLRGRRRDNEAGELSCLHGSEQSAVYPDVARTPTARGDSSPCADRGQNIVAIPSCACDGEKAVLCAATGQTGAEVLEDQAPTLTCHHEQPILYKAVGVNQNQSGDVNISDTAYSLATNGNATGRNAPLVAHPTINGVFESHGQDARYTGPHNIAPAVTSTYGMGGGNIPLTFAPVHPEISGTLCASGAGLSRPAGMASETDLCVVQPIPINDKATRCSGGGPTRKDDGAGNGLGVGQPGDPAPTITAADRHAVATYCLQGNKARRGVDSNIRGGVMENASYPLMATDCHAVAAYCLQGNMIGRKDENGPNGSGIMENASFTLTATDVAAVAAVDCRNMRETEELSGTLQAKENGSYSLNYQNPVRLGYIVRRLTPTECERLQGYPDGWTAYGHDGKPISDTARYMMLGNSIAVPCVAYIMLGIAEASKTGVYSK